MSSKLKKDPYKLVGTTLDSFRIEEFIQSGGMGAVYRARPRRADIPLAIKILKPDLALEHPETAALLLREAEQTASLHHPNIIRVTYADINEAGYAYIVMEWLDGRSLEQELKIGGPMEPERVAALIEQICGALAHAHRQGIVHRDLNPRNVMLTQDYAGQEQIKILDFGIAKAIDATFGINSRIIGQPYYASPEQLTLNSGIDHRADIYSLGVTAYQLLTGELPFNGDSLGQVIQQHLTGTPRLLSQIREGIPEAVEAVIMRALAKRPEERFQSAEEFSRALRTATALGGATVSLLCLDAETDAPLAGASVHLNGRYAGCSDEWGTWSKVGLMPGECVLEVECPRYERLSRRLNCKAGEDVSFEVELTPKPVGDLLVRTSVSYATVTVNGEEVGTTDGSGALSLRGVVPGPAQVRLRHPKYHDASADVEITRGQEQRVEVEMRPRSLLSPLRWLRRAPKPARPPVVKRPRPRLKVFLKICVAMVAVAVVGAAAWWSFLYFTTGSLLIRTARPGARVVIDGDGRELTTDTNGNLFIKNLKRGTHTVEINSEGFKKLQQSIEMPGRENDIPLTLLPDAAYHVERGKRFYAEGNLAEAAAAFREAVDIDRNNSEYLRLLADVLREQEQIDEAEETYGKICRLSPETADCYYRTGLEWLGWNYPRRAVKAFTAARDNAGDDDKKTALYLAQRSVAFLAVPDTEAALTDARAAVEKDKECAVCQGILGDVYAKKDDYDNAKAAYQSAVELMPESYEYHFKLARALYNGATKSTPDSNPNWDADLNSAKEHFQSASSFTADAAKKQECDKGIENVNAKLNETASN